MRLRCPGSCGTCQLAAVVDTGAVLLRGIAYYFAGGGNAWLRVMSVDRPHEDDLIAALGALGSGDAEGKLAGILHPQDVNFLGDDLVMAYPKYSMDFLVQKRHISMLQQPSFLQLSRAQSALFYRLGVQWTRCTPAAWFSSAG